MFCILQFLLLLSHSFSEGTTGTLIAGIVGSFGGLVLGVLITAIIFICYNRCHYGRGKCAYFVNYCVHSYVYITHML